MLLKIEDLFSRSEKITPLQNRNASRSIEHLVQVKTAILEEDS
ncbi:hypothetical protein SAMN05444409_1474 [Epilithonimonas zeae]|uniref:Uncharacterized protein n=1 Tax=Epilithonimonas zeae TaxID=1416779 RepID=A0A1N6FTX9_9FLAO|nr:hypothetical protein SAMN05444409_1474 [Epilithonimonas zeae]